ncbi:trigger factor [Neoehrlichia mikurensis]|uniref:Trigger factor n=1 Tax=Neoehrlichia mikurensis TaxID=89586 RepID=A0A9Q9F365_9RICK|nr:trigger factor [Neoehrlichia mikurensis]QXK92137.1 trigger factor [Neoehrlichia mikurensis]QXK92594.1 trigger factor [Neoehrlichia mikurensis]QXK93831.1 trigger factor [Neoehrlichia mikurensis]UTO55174.1 trigger factor [Neoehrlichia mikurensis]UTO56094.1 trigger factor [Neoehrlichia mikurensis]
MDRFYVAKEILKSALKYEYEVTIDHDYFQRQLDDKFKEVAKFAKISGFRPGKVSIDIVKKYYFDDVVNAVVSKVIEDTSSSFMKENNFQEVISSNVDVRFIPDEKASSDNIHELQLMYKLQFEIMPEIPCFDIESVTLKDREVLVDDKDIDNFVNNLNSKYVNFVHSSDIHHGICIGDKVIINYYGKMQGKAFKGGSAKNYEVVIGNGHLLENFENQLIGMKKGEQKIFTLVFPDDYKHLRMAGKEVEMLVDVQDIFVSKEAENNEELAKGYGFDSVEAMLAFSEKAVKEKCTQMNNIIMKKELFDYMDENYVIDIPECIISEELKKVNYEVSSGKLSTEVDSLKEATRRIKLGMLLIKVSKDHNVSLTSEDVVNFIKNNYVDYGASFNNVVKLLKSNKDFDNYIKGKVLEDKVVDYIICSVKKEKENITYSGLEELFNSVS